MVAAEAVEAPASNDGAIMSEQRKLLEQADPPLAVGAKWYLVCAQWYAAWETFVRPSSPFQKQTSPGIIDNSRLMDADGNLRRFLMERIDYKLFDEDRYKTLKELYGSTHDIERVVIERKYARSSELIIEVYPLSFSAYVDGAAHDTRQFHASKACTTKALKSMLCEAFGVPDDDGSRIYDVDEHAVLTATDAPLYDLVREPAKVCVQRVGSDGSWPVDAAAAVADTKSFGSSSWSSSYKPYYSKKTSSPGTMGLQNLGQTCFMNSALQCLMHTAPLTDFFLTTKYEEQLNRSNPLGMNGEVAEQYAKLVRLSASGNESYCSPTDFKYTIGRFAPQFSGYQQHDSQELLAFLLDGMHEDLNRIVKKPYVEAKDANGRPDDVVAAEAWHDHQLRNDSIIVDLFQGQYKSTVVCPECERVSVTFDPFMYLSLPLPSVTSVTMPVLFIPADAAAPLRWLTVELAKRWDASQIADAVAQQTKSDAALLHVALMSDHMVQSYAISPTSIDADDIIVVYELDVPYRMSSYGDEKRVNITIALRYQDDQMQRHFGVPLIFSVPPSATYGEVYQLAKRLLARLAKDPEAFVALPDCEPAAAADSDVAMDDDSADQALEQAFQQNAGSAAAPMPTLFQFRSKYSSSRPKSADDKLATQSGDSYLLDVPSSIFAAHFASTNASYDARQAYSKVGSKGGINLYDCLALYSKREQLGADNAWYCPKCAKHQEASKQLELFRLPEILVIHLKRFQYNMYARDKIDTLVDFPLQGLDLSGSVKSTQSEPPIYDLFAVSNHFGSLSSGHYTAFALNSDGKWYNFDDSSVEAVSADQVVSRSAYMLLYRRRGAASKM